MAAKDIATQKEFRPIYTDAIKAHIETRNWEKLRDVLVGGEQVKVDRRLLKKGWIFLAKHEAEAGRRIESIEDYAAARAHDLADIRLVKEIAAQLGEFFDDFSDKFSKQDILGLLEPLDRLISFHNIHRQQRVPEELGRLREDLQRRLETAASRIETPATPYVLRIFAALYSDKMTAEEVRAEFARLIAPEFREYLAKETKKRPKPKKKRPKVRK